MFPNLLNPTSIKQVVLRLDTIKCQQIDNLQVSELSPFERAQDKIVDEQIKRNRWSVTSRAGASPIYNCHGMTFASKRTGISESSAIQLILEHDGYSFIDRKDVLPGDIILYCSETGDFEHSGLVVSHTVATSLGLFWVVSKWGKSGEFLHLESHCPYEKDFLKFVRKKNG